MTDHLQVLKLGLWGALHEAFVKGIVLAAPEPAVLWKLLQIALDTPLALEHALHLVPDLLGKSGEGGGEEEEGGEQATEEKQKSKTERSAERRGREGKERGKGGKAGRGGCCCPIFNLKRYFLGFSTEGSPPKLQIAFSSFSEKPLKCGKGQEDERPSGKRAVQQQGKGKRNKKRERGRGTRKRKERKRGKEVGGGGGLVSLLC